MNTRLLILFVVFFSVLVAFADTPPPNTVKAKVWSGDGNTSVTVTGSSLNTNVTNASIPVTGTFWQATQPVSAASLPLPAGAATAALQTAINNTLGSPFQAGGNIGNTSFISTQATAANLNATVVGPSGVALAKDSSLTAINTTLGTPMQNSGGSVTANAGTGTFLVDGSAHTQPVSGVFFQTTQPISAASLPLPSGASTSAKQPALGTAGTASSDVLTVQGIASMTALKVDGTGGTFPVTGTFFQATQPVSAVSLPLPTGAATSALQTTGNTSLGSIDTKTPALGQALAAASTPVVLTAAQITTLTPLSTVTANQGTANSTPWNVNQSGRARANSPIRNDYSTNNATTSAYLQIVASTTSAASVICIFDSSGQDLVLATGAAASEVDQIEIFPGGNGCEPMSIAASTRLSVKAKSALANSGVLLVNLYQ